MDVLQVIGLILCYSSKNIILENIVKIYSSVLYCMAQLQNKLHHNIKYVWLSIQTFLKNTRGDAWEQNSFIFMSKVYNTICVLDY